MNSEPKTEEDSNRLRKDAGLGCEKCNYTGVFAGKLGGKWTYYPQIKCDCAALSKGA